MKFAKHLSIYTIVGFLGAGVNFFLLPYLSHFIHPGEYGILAMVNSYVTILIPLIGLTAAGIISVDYFRIKDKKEFASLFSSVQVIPLLPALFFLIIALFFGDRLAIVLEIPPEKSYWLSISVVIALLTIYSDTMIAFAVTEQRPAEYAAFNLGKLAVEVLLTIWFVTGLKLNWEGRLLSWLLANILFFIVSFIYCYKRRLLTTRISRTHIIAAISFGLPLILHTLGKFVVNQSDRIFIAKMVSIDEAGIYNVGYQIGIVMLILVTAIGNFMYPYISERLVDDTYRRKKQIVVMSYIVTGISVVALLVATFGAPLFFEYFLDKSYQSAAPYVFWVALGYFFWGIYLICSAPIFFTKRTRFLAWLAILNILLNAGMNYIFIQHFGAIGAAYATCASFFVIAVLTFLESNRRIPLPWLFFLNKHGDQNNDGGAPFESPDGDQNQ